MNLPKLNAEGNGYSSEILYARGTGLTYGAPGEYANEWVGGRWYDGEGKQTYMGIGSWHKNLKGWWYGDSCGWYANNRWKKIDGKWYYFDRQGYMVTGTVQIGGTTYRFADSGEWIREQ